MKSAFAVNLEYLTLRTCCGLVNAIPYPLAMSLARGLGWVGFNILRIKHARTLERIHGVFPEKSRRQCVAIAVESLQNVLMMAVEMIRAAKLDRVWMDRYVKDGQKYKDILQSYVDEGKGVVIMVPHSGNFYMPAWSMAKYGLPLVALASRQRNPKVDAWMNRQYGDIETLDRDSRETLMKIHEKLREGRAFAIMTDLRVRHPDVEVDFFGGKANVSHAGAAFAVNAGCPIVVAIMSHEGDRHTFRHLATLRPDPQAPDKKSESKRLTRIALKTMSDAIMEKPGEWYWFNKRWILEPIRK